MAETDFEIPLRMCFDMQITALDHEHANLRAPASNNQFLFGPSPVTDLADSSDDTPIPLPNFASDVFEKVGHCAGPC